MPFNSAGVYTPATGATTAAPGNVIKSAIWNGIFTDLSSALTLLGQQIYNVTDVTATPYDPTLTDTILFVNFNSAVSIVLPLASTRIGYPLVVKDISGAAATGGHNITITAHSGDTIEGSGSTVISTNYGHVKLYPISGEWYIL